MNEGDAFVLDLGLTLYVWKGAECNKYEDKKAADVRENSFEIEDLRREDGIIDDDDSLQKEPSVTPN